MSTFKQKLQVGSELPLFITDDHRREANQPFWPKGVRLGNLVATAAIAYADKLDASRADTEASMTRKSRIHKNKFRVFSVRQQIRAAVIVAVMIILGAVFATLADAQCVNGACSTQRPMRWQVQRGHMHDHVQHVTRYRRGKMKVFRVWRVPLCHRRVLLAE